MRVELIARRWENALPRSNGRKRSPYKASWTSIAAMLRHELAMIGADRAVIEMDVQESELRNDGWIRSDASPGIKAVRVYFECKYGPLRYEAETWSDWQHNVYAVARTLRNQRMMARDGCVKGDQVYRGWKALPSAPAVDPDLATVDSAVRFLIRVAGWIERPEVPPNMDQVFRDAARRAHPDTGGSNELMAKVNAARALVERRAGS